MQRVGLHQLAQSGAVTAQVPVWNDTTKKWEPLTPAPSISPTLVDAKGDLLIGTADNTPARLAVGANGAVLTADSTAAAGMAWKPVAIPLDQLLDVDVTTATPNTGDTLVYNDGTEMWTPGAPAGGGGGSGGPGGLLLEADQTTADVPSDTPVGTIVFRKVAP